MSVRSHRMLPHAALTALLASLVAGPLVAAEEKPRGYLVNPYGEVLKTGYGECWRTRFPSQSSEEQLREYAEQCGDEVESTQAAAETEADSDGDGVPDSADACPGTAAGATVDEQGCRPDTDGDGVVDGRDACPGTGAGRPVDSRGCLADDDGDGVANDRDDCLGTPEGAPVDDRGCEIDTSIDVTLSGANFASNSAELPDELKPKLNEIARRIRETSGGERLRIVGYTDSRGDAEYNRELSRRRAQAVADYLYERGIDRFMMEVVGRGEANPVASNETAEGRARNRRVEITTQ